MPRREQNNPGGAACGVEAAKLGGAACPEGNSAPGGAACPGGAAKLGGSSMPRGEQHAQGSGIKGLHIAAFLEIEEFENDSPYH
jgi:hypothetical protein